MQHRRVRVAYRRIWPLCVSAAIAIPSLAITPESEGFYTSLNCGPGSGDKRSRVIENRDIALRR